MTKYAYAIGGRSDPCGYPLPGVESYRYRLDRSGEALTNLEMAEFIEQRRLGIDPESQRLYELYGMLNRSTKTQGRMW